MRRPRLLIADNAQTRQGIRMALQDEVEICAEVADAEQAIRAAMREQPELCLVARGLPGGGLHAVRGISRAAPDPAIVVIAEVADVDDMLESVRAGAVGYLPAAASAEHLRRVVRAVNANEAALPRAMVMELVLELRGGGAGSAQLTAREAQVLRLLRRGHTTAAIARRLEIAPVTVRRHISGLVSKLGVGHRGDLVSDGSRWSAPPAPAGAGRAGPER